MSRRTGSTHGGSLERMLSRLVDGSVALAKRGVALGLLLPAAQGFVGCAEGAGTGGSDASTGADTLFLYGNKADWAQKEGQRNVDMVTYLGEYWTEASDCSNRGGCMTINVFLKMKVKTVEGASLDKKRVGIVCETPFCAEGSTYLGHYFSNLGGGYEEWHIPVTRRGWDPAAFAFTAWYQDGTGKTWYDDNAGEFHPVAYRGAYPVVSHDYTKTKIKVTEKGVQGTLSLFVAKLDFDKDLRLVWTTDAWATVNEYKIGGADEPNKLHWVSDLWSGYENWQANLDIPGEFQKFEYAVVYRHGVINNAKTYDFWDSNGGANHIVTRDSYTTPITDIIGSSPQ